MSDLAQSTPKPPPPFLDGQELDAFRETMLRHFTRAEDQAALRQVGRLLFESALEQAHLWPLPEESETVLALRAAALDLLHTARTLTALGHSRWASLLSPAEETLARLAERSAPQVERLARRLAQAAETPELHGQVPS
ncbi:MAG TPA: hypothetical protein VF017_03965 [Thermoanaerobaculia bacterium]|nr:hypothetical protein [Thermoanaerobaculia bacterium]